MPTDKSYNGSLMSLQWLNQTKKLVECVKPQKEAKSRNITIITIWNKKDENLINAAGENGEFVCIITVQEIIKNDDFHYEQLNNIV